LGERNLRGPGKWDPSQGKKKWGGGGRRDGNGGAPEVLEVAERVIRPGKAGEPSCHGQARVATSKKSREGKREKSSEGGGTWGPRRNEGTSFK